MLFKKEESPSQDFENRLSVTTIQNNTLSPAFWNGCYSLQPNTNRLRALCSYAQETINRIDYSYNQDNLWVSSPPVGLTLGYPLH
jgi:hypothetical protein